MTHAEALRMVRTAQADLRASRLSTHLPSYRNALGRLRLAQNALATHHRTHFPTSTQYTKLLHAKALTNVQ